eukprot:CAMPEP_0168423380 /NCGR_PEP_ID=MMETSP0228-20121227/34278_1 /TAXON_ID=133427 /ORGANISM="Protoceratium reticulatum, Strain CCCM 535 (=CCMP 1889)" /LENGTH=427 /DNA_ID=CAMNT_0008437339 /DNA_START=55 /DNA_END=1337 /DNA_ORIENTATION=+
MWNLQVLQKFVLLITSPCIPTVCGFKNDLTENCEGPAKLQPLADERTSHLLEIVHVVYSGDARTFPGLVSSMISLARHLQVPEKCVIHLIVSEGDLGRARRMVHVFKHELGSMAALPNVTLHRMQALPLDISRFETPWFRPELLTAHNYARFYLHQYLPGVQRALWLDPDTIVRSDVMPLYRMRMQHALAARPFLVNGYNLLGELRERFKMFAYQSPRRHWDFPNESLHMPTFSTGVLLYDLNLWRSGSLTRALERWSQVLLGFMGTQLVMSVQFVDKFDPMDGGGTSRASELLRRGSRSTALMEQRSSTGLALTSHGFHGQITGCGGSGSVITTTSLKPLQSALQRDAPHLRVAGMPGQPCMPPETLTALWLVGRMALRGAHDCNLAYEDGMRYSGYFGRQGGWHWVMVSRTPEASVALAASAAPA